MAANKTKDKTRQHRPLPRINRRTLLRGAAGTALALPLLECMMPAKQANAQVSPKRLLMSFCGASLNTDSAPGQQSLIPQQQGPNYDVGEMLSPVLGFPDANGNPVRDQISVVSNLRIGHNSGELAQRAAGDSFHFHTNPMLCGGSQLGEFDTTATGPSADQVVADAFQDQTVIRNLNYRAQALFYNLSGGIDVPANRDTMSFKQEATGVFADLPQASPKTAWDKLILLFPSSNPEEARQQALERQKRISVLDEVDRNMSGLLPRLSAFDRQRMERHYDEVRALEKLLEADIGAFPPACVPIDDPMDDPPLGTPFDQPFDWNVNSGYSGEIERAKVFTRLLHMAFVCDLTRVATMMYTMFQSFLNAHPLVGASYNVHALNHLGQQSQHELMIKWHVEQFAELVSMLRDTPEGDGSVLDNCAMTMLIEGGVAVGNGPMPGGPSHTTEGMACLIAGGAGGLRRGEHIVAPAGLNHPANVQLALMNAVGVEQNTFNEVSGVLDSMFG